MTQHFVTLEPRSSKARNRLANSMGGNPLVVLEQVDNGKVFVASEDRSFATWINLPSDPNWSIKL